MKLLVCGSRTMPRDQLNLVMAEIEILKPKSIICGGAKGADTLAAFAATLLRIPCEEFPADWDKHGKAAGPIRNQQMMEEKPDQVLAFHHVSGITPGTKDMVTRAVLAKVPVKVVTYGKVAPIKDHSQIP